MYKKNIHLLLIGALGPLVTFINCFSFAGLILVALLTASTLFVSLVTIRFVKSIIPFTVVLVLTNELMLNIFVAFLLSVFGKHEEQMWGAVASLFISIYSFPTILSVSYSAFYFFKNNGERIR